MRRTCLALLVLALLGSLIAPAAAQEADGRHRDFGDEEGFAAIVPPGQKGRFNAAEAAALRAGQEPAHFNDQTPLYESLVYEGGMTVGADPRTRFLGVTDGDLPRFFTDGQYGTPAPERVYSPTQGLTIIRGSAFGVPTIVGETRAAGMFGAGYIAAEDRMFLLDVLRHLGRGRISELLGPSESNMAMDRAQLRIAPYQEAELTQQVLALCAGGPEGARVCADLDAYTDGVNAFFAEARRDPRLLANEYVALQIVPEDWRREDVVAIASLVGGIFGRGGGGEVASGRFLSQLQIRHGAEEGRRIWADFRSAEDPEAPTTATRAFPYNDHDAIDASTTALLDLEGADDAMAQMAMPEMILDGPLGPIDLRGVREGSSNAILASSEVTDGGIPIAVFGPQTGYFTPQLLVEMDIHAPGISARGVAFAGTNFYVQLGRGDGYAWSATSASADNVDQWVLELCNVDGSPPTAQSQAYRHDGACRAMDVYDHVQRAKPTAGGLPSDPRDVQFTIEIERSVYGPVVARGTVQGRPVAISVERSTYGAELASAIGFQRINDPQFMSRGAAAFNDAFDGVDYTFNWFYVDGTDIAYKHSCRCPIRDPRTDPDLPTWGTGEFDWTGEFLSPAQQPQAVNPASGFLVSWNNKQAPGFRANDGQFSYSSTYRSEFLASRMRASLATDRLLTRADMVNVMADAATVDLNGQEIYPLALRVMGERAPGGDPRLQAMRDRLAEWVAAGGHRRDLGGDAQDPDAATVAPGGDGTYDHAVAVAIGDAFLRPALDATFGDELGDAELPNRVEDHPRLRLGSAYNGGQANFLHKDLRQVLRDLVIGPRSRTYCGGGERAACAAGLWEGLARAGVALAEEYDSDDVADWVYDSSLDEIRQSPAGVPEAPRMQWQNRPTYQQVVQVGSRTGRVSGASRTLTSAAVSRQAFPEGAETVVVASAGDFPDALAGTPLAGVLEAPVLLTPRDRLAGEITREVRRLGARTAVVLGGPEAVSEAVLGDLADAGVTDVRRISGPNRFATAAAIAAELDADSGGAVVASGEDFADALVAGPFAGAAGIPILLTGRGVLPPETSAALDGLDEVILAGGPSAVTDAVRGAIDAQVGSVRRVAGPDRFATAVAFAGESRQVGLSSADTYVTTGLRFPDALSAGAAALATGGTVLLAPPARLAQAPVVSSALAVERADIDRLWLVGGPAVLPSTLRRDVEATIAR
jgi:acyl-homoserine lactone acylase PvdQ/putative cell wall-binding protein